MSPETNARAVALIEMRKQRHRERRGRTHDGEVESPEVESSNDDDRSQASEPLGEDVFDTETGGVPSPETEDSHDLDSLGEEIERSLTGSADMPQPVRAQSNAVAPPSRNATPEDILGLHTQTYEQVEESRPSTEPEEASGARDLSAETGGSPPMEDFEERAAMAKEVLRATSDGPRRSRKAPKVETADEASPEEIEDVADENVRFSEDLTISAKKRQRRKLFGR
jgi:hypothetical protein